MKILVLGGTRFFGRHLVSCLLQDGHEVSVATRGFQKRPLPEQTEQIILNRTDADSLRRKLSGRQFDIVYDNIAYSSNDVRVLWDSIGWSPAHYVMTSSAAVYSLHTDTKESDFDPVGYPLRWCGREEVSYQEGKRQAECAAFREYPHISTAAVRFPFVIGEDDYTNRLSFYVEQIVKGKEINVDNAECQMAFVSSKEAGAFLAYLAQRPFVGPINGCSPGSISVCRIADYVKQRTGKEIQLSLQGDAAPYNGTSAYDLNTEACARMGFAFSPLSEWIYRLLDFYIEKWTVSE